VIVCYNIVIESPIESLRIITFSYFHQEGTGTYLWPDGQKYVGEYKNGKRHGKGSWSWPDGSIYEGDLVEGNRSGFGVTRYCYGGRFEGYLMKFL
jgi:hypothetical protein